MKQTTSLNKYIDRKFSIYYENFNLLSIILIFFISHVTNINTTKINMKTINLNVLIFNDFVYLMSIILITLNLLLIIRSNLIKKFQTIDIKQPSKYYFILLVFFVFSFFILINKLGGPLIYILMKKSIEDNLGLILIFEIFNFVTILISLASVFYIYYFLIKEMILQMKMNYNEINDFNHYFDNDFNLNKKTHQNESDFKGFTYGDVTFDINRNKAYVFGHSLNLKNLRYYLELNSKKINDLNDFDFNIIEMMDY